MLKQDRLVQALVSFLVLMSVYLGCVLIFVLKDASDYFGGDCIKHLALSTCHSSLQKKERVYQNETLVLLSFFIFVIARKCNRLNQKISTSIIALKHKAFDVEERITTYNVDNWSQKKELRVVKLKVFKKKKKNSNHYFWFTEITLEEMQTDAKNIRELLKKTQHHDKDERFMATSDLTAELEKVEGQLDASLQTPIRDAIMKQLDDPSNDVQAIACNCYNNKEIIYLLNLKKKKSLSAIVQKFSCEQVEEITDKLGMLLVEGRMELRDIYTIALQNIISSVPDDFGPQIFKKLVRRLIQGLKMQQHKGDTDEETQEYGRNHLNRLVACLDIMKDLVNRFGHVAAESHEEILSTVQPMLSQENQDIRKKVAVTLGSLVTVIDDKLFSNLLGSIINQIKKLKREDEKLFTYIQTIGVFSKNGGKRIAAYLNDVVPLLMSICTDEKMESDYSETSVDLRENCLQAFDTLIVQCPKDISDYTDQLLTMGLNLMKFDPLWSYEDEVEENKTSSKSKQEAGDDDGFGDGGDDGWGDDTGAGDGWGDDGGDAPELGAGDAGDTTWKIRRAALKMLASYIQTHKHQVLEHQLRLVDELLGQFREHDPTVKLELFNTFRELLLASIVAESGMMPSQLLSLDIPALARQKSEFHIISERVKDIIKHVVREMKRGNAEVRSGLLGIVRDLVVVRQAERSKRCDVLGEEGLSEFFPELIPQIVTCVSDSDAQLKNQGLHVLYLILKRHSESEGLKIVKEIKDVVISSILEEYSRVKAQGLMAAGRILECIRPLKSGVVNYDRAYDATAKKLFEVSFKQLDLKDVEQEVKKAALDTIAIAVAHFGDLLVNDCANILDILCSRLGNDVTRQTALHAFATIADSPLKIDLSKHVNKLIGESSSFLRKHQQSLKVDTAVTLRSLFRSSGAKVEPKMTQDLIVQCTEFIHDSDLYLCSLILELLSEILRIQPQSAKVMSEAAFPKTMEFLQSPLLQGHALTALKEFFQTFQITTHGKVIKYETLKSELLKTARPGLSRQSYIAVSQCLSTLTLQVDDKAQYEAVTELIAAIGNKEENHAQVALLCIGELGRKRDLSLHSDIEQKIFQGFFRESEAVKWAASFALGNVAVGNLSKFVPSLLKLIQQKEDRQYLLLNSLKEVISAHSHSHDSQNAILPYAETIVPLLLKNASSSDEGVRAMVAECLGNFAILERRIYSDIGKLLDDKDPATRSTMATSLKFALNKEHITLPPETVERFLNLLSDKDLGVKRSAFLTINTILHINHTLIYASFDSIVPIIYKATITDPSLIKEVDLGPFKHRVDDGLPLRKAAFQCMDTLLDNTASKIELGDFIAHLKNGATDESFDIQMLTYQILYKLAHSHGPSIISSLDELPDTLMKGIKAKLNEAKGPKDAERAKDVLRAACKALYALYTIPNAAKAKQYCSFYSRVEKTNVLIPIIAELKKEAQKR
ncbi:hypothetical protein RFI_14352 [Reticulomyxa filosa]|uniref:TATA-binding protein interacting (TIP20) domain-containing protein n=1 Tax=Reticulomyxa filosa TaxID=46433 RepID=X6N9Z3_RETFI|nr:hypothetical protein RFI_14352 [Reticulomyxa filosa]|eukprot:ETO22841.1 hypothetical protein RFI_14352 [Reticulomyxa filosa]